MHLNRLSRNTLATLIAILFHTVGLVGIFTQTGWITGATAFNLLLSAALLVWTENNRNFSFWLLAGSCYFTGLVTEIIGVNTGLLFGQYQYGSVLGPRLFNVPLVIGINWFIVMYCCGNTLLALLNRLLPGIPGRMKAWSLVVDSALLAVLFDWLIEPVAVQLGYWTWEGGVIPALNYFSWLIISLLLMLVFNRTKKDLPNQFAVHLLMIQVLFFLVLRAFLL